MPRTDIEPASEERAKSPLLADTVTKLDGAGHGRVVVCGSHGGSFSGAVAATAGIRAIVLHDAGVGRDAAGIASLALLNELSIPAATVDHRTAHIGDAAEMYEQGIISHVNENAMQHGCRPGQTVQEAVELLEDVPFSVTSMPTAAEESRTLLIAGPIPVWALDSASLVRSEDAGSIIVTGSHGRLVGGRPEFALQVDARAALFNDAGDPPVPSSPSRLSVLDERRTPAATVSAETARIGEARSTFHDGILSSTNYAARALGIDVGMPATEFITTILQIGMK